MESKNSQLMDIENRLAVARDRGGGWEKWVKGVKSYIFQL